MRDYNKTFLDSLKEIGDLLGESNFESAFKTSNGLTLFTSLSEYPDGVFISEVLEGIFSQIGPILDNFQVPDDDLAATMSEIQAIYADFITAVEGEDRSGVFEALVKLRFIATQFQLKWSRIGKSKPSKKGLQIPPQVEAMMKNVLQH